MSQSSETSGRPGGPVVLLVTARSGLAEEVGRLAAAAGVPVRVAAGVEEAAGLWARAPLVLLGEDAAELGVPARRPAVVLVAAAGAPERLWRRALEVGAEAVVQLPTDQGVLLDRLVAVGDPGAGPGRVVAVLGGSGGAGASVLAAAIATVAAPRQSVVLVDGDPFGGGADLLLGVEGQPGLRWRDLLGARGAIRASVLHDGLPVAASGARVLSWSSGSGAAARRPAGLAGSGPQRAGGVTGGGAGEDEVAHRSGPPSPAAVEAVLEAAERAHDLVVLDLPRRDDPATTSLLWRADLLVLLVRVELRAVLAAASLAVLVDHAADARVVLVPVAGSGLSGADALDALGLPLLSELRREPGLVADLARGGAPGSRSRGPLARTARAALSALEAAQRPVAAA